MLEPELLGSATHTRNSLLLVAGLAGVGVAALALTGATGRPSKGDKIGLALMAGLGLCALYLVDVDGIRAYGVRVTTPFIVAVTIGLLRMLRR